jgi:hypothetical protein
MGRLLSLILYRPISEIGLVKNGVHMASNLDEMHGNRHAT